MANSMGLVVSLAEMEQFYRGDKAGQVRMERDPGSQIPPDENGKLVLTQAQPGQ